MVDAWSDAAADPSGPPPRSRPFEPAYLAVTHRNHLEVGEFKSNQCLVRQTFPRESAVRLVITQCYGQDARVNDNHDPPEPRRPQP